MWTTHDDPYRLAARWYDFIIEPLNRKLRAIGIGLHQPRAGDAVLDVGCGTGTTLELYWRAGCEVWGLDASAAMLAVARQRLGKRARLHLGDATRLPHEADSFDAVMFTFVLHEVPPATRVAALREAVRVLRPGGRVVVIDYAAAPLRFPRGWALKALVTAIERSAGGEHWANYRHFVSHGAAGGLAAELDLETAAERVVGGGNLAITLLRPRAG